MLLLKLYSLFSHRFFLVGLAILGLLFTLPHAGAQEPSPIEFGEEISISPTHKKSLPDTLHINRILDRAENLRFIEPDSLMSLSQKAIDLSIKIKYLKGEYMALTNMADYYSDKGQHCKAIDLYSEALEKSQKSANSLSTISIADRLATEYQYNGNYSAALKGNLENLELAQKHKDQEMESIIYENIANLYADQKDYPQALYFFDKVKKINTAVGNEFSSAETMSNLAYTYMEMNNYRDAHTNIDKSITVFKRTYSSEWLAYAYMVKGKIFLKESKYSMALYWFNESHRIHKNLQDERSTIDLYNGMAEANFALKNDSLALAMAQKSYDISSKINSLSGIQECAHTLYKIYKKSNSHATALKYHEIYQKMSDTLSRDENKNSLTLLKTEIEHKKQQEALVLENNKALARQRNYIYASGILIIIIAIVAFIIYQERIVQKNLNTELKKQKRNLEIREAELQASNDTKNKLFSIIAHDLRGPIGALEGLLKLLNAGDMNSAEFMKFVPRLKNDVNNISFTLNNLLSWGQSQLKRMHTKVTKLDLKDLVTENINLLNELSDSKSIQVSNLVPATIAVEADINQFHIILRNLLSNAIKFTPNNGSITIGATEKENHVEVFVQDTGLGIPQEIQLKLFQENSNYTTYGTNEEKGTGLGLSLCREMINNNGGKIWVESEAGQGSTFFFTLPNFKKQIMKSA